MPDQKAPVHRRPKVMPGTTYKLPSGCGNLYITITTNEGEPWEVFLKLGKCGSCPAATLEALGRAVSIGLRAGVKPSQYVKTLKGIACQSPTHEDGILIASCVDACALALEEAIKEKND